MTTSLTNRDKFLLLVLADVLIVFAAYMTVVKRFDAKRAVAEAQLAELAPQLQDLQTYEANQASYEAKIVKLRDEIDTQLRRFPNDIRNEHILLNAKTLQDVLGVKVQSVGSEPAALLSSFQLPLKDESGQYVMQKVYAFTTSENIQCSLDYDQFKSLLDFIYSQNERTALKSISVTYNSENGVLSGTAAITKYFIVPEKYVYEKADIEGVQQGVTNPFGTARIRNGSSAAVQSGTTAKTSGSVTEIRPPETNTH